MKAFFVAVLMTGIGFGANSNCLETAGEEPSYVSGSCGFGSLGDFLVVGFFGGMFLKCLLRLLFNNHWTLEAFLRMLALLLCVL
jgi:hypothetical protein